MNTQGILWTYALASDVEVCPGEGGAFLRTPIDHTWVEGANAQRTLRLLSGMGGSEPEICHQLRSEHDRGTETDVAALLFRPDRLGLLARSLTGHGRRIVTCVPLRPPPQPPPARPPDGPLRLSPYALARAERNVVYLEAPGCWARMAIHERSLLPLLHDLAVERLATDLVGSVGYPQEAILAVLGLMNWCGLIDISERAGPATTCCFTCALVEDTPGRRLASAVSEEKLLIRPRPRRRQTTCDNLLSSHQICLGFSPAIRRMRWYLSDGNPSDDKDLSHSHRANSRSSCFGRFMSAADSGHTQAEVPCEFIIADAIITHGVSRIGPVVPALVSREGTGAPELSAVAVSKYFGGVCAVDKVTFTVQKGEIVSVIGPNGAGKTSLLNLISGFFRPDSGAMVR